MHLTKALARLLSDRGLRESFHRDRAEVARRLGVSNGHLSTFLSIDEAGLAVQAETILKKRFHEVAKLLPHTVGQLGWKAKTHFWTYAESYWPSEYRRHLDDAVHFCRFLLDFPASYVYRSELNRLRFALEGRRLAVHAVSDLIVAGKPRRAIQVLYRGSERQPRQLAICSRL